MFERHVRRGRDGVPAALREKPRFGTALRAHGAALRHARPARRGARGAAIAAIRRSRCCRRCRHRGQRPRVAPRVRARRSMSGGRPSSCTRICRSPASNYAQALEFSGRLDEALDAVSARLRDVARPAVDARARRHMPGQDGARQERRRRSSTSSSSCADPNTSTPTIWPCFATRSDSGGGVRRSSSGRAKRTRRFSIDRRRSEDRRAPGGPPVRDCPRALDFDAPTPALVDPPVARPCVRSKTVTAECC